MRKDPLTLLQRNSVRRGCMSMYRKHHPRAPWQALRQHVAGRFQH